MFSAQIARREKSHRKDFVCQCLKKLTPISTSIRQNNLSPTIAFSLPRI
jgi:hypothetical protein